jgi:hypothetical protein
MTDDDTDNRSDVLNSHAYVAVGLLADAIGPDTYHGGDVDEARDHLRTGLAAGATDTGAGRRIEAALEYLDDLEEKVLEERRLKVRDALAELAPVAAGLTDPAGPPERTPREQKPTVPVFYHVPRPAADRAIHRFRYGLRHADDRNEESLRNPGASLGRLRDWVYQEVRETPVIYVDGEPLAEYASGRVDRLTIDRQGGELAEEGSTDI